MVAGRGREKPRRDLSNKNVSKNWNWRESYSILSRDGAASHSYSGASDRPNFSQVTSCFYLGVRKFSFNCLKFY